MKRFAREWLRRWLLTAGRYFVLMACLAGPLADIAIAGEKTPAPLPPPKADSGDEPKPKPADKMPDDVDWSAMRQSVVEEKGAIVLSGSAWVRYKGNKLEADHIVFFRRTKEVYAEGNIRLRAGESEMSAEAAYVDINNDTGYLIDATVRVSAPPHSVDGLTGKKKEKDKEDKDAEREALRNIGGDKAAGGPNIPFIRARDPYGVYVDVLDDPQARTNLIFRAQKIVKHSKLHFTAEDAFVTTDEMVHPMYGVKAGQLDFFMRQAADPDRPGRTDLKPNKITIKRARLNIYGLSLFPFPTLTYDFQKRNSFFQANTGSSKRWGQFALIRIGYGLGGGEDKLFDPTHVYLDLDERWKRGPAGGFELDWQTGRRPVESQGDKNKFERGEGHIRAYGTEETQISERDDTLRARRDLERRIQPEVDGFPRRVYDANRLFLQRRRLSDVGPPSFEIDKHGDEFRGFVDFQHHQPLQRFAGIDNLQLDFNYERQSDRDFMLEYFQNQYMTNNQPDALASIRKPGDNYSIELLYRGNTQDFDGAPARHPFERGTFTSYEPSLTYSLTPTPLKWGFYLQSELQAARLKREFEREIYDTDGFEANRVYARMNLSRPFKFGVVNFVPHLGTQQAAYDNSRQGAEAFQGAVTYGLDATTRFYGYLPDFENEALGLRGMRHIIEPRISYMGVSDTRESAEDLLDFDEVENLMPLDKVTFSIEQTAQTRRASRDGTLHTTNFAGLDLSVDWYPRERDQARLLSGDALDLFRIDGFLRVIDAVKLDASAGFSIENGDLEKAAVGVTIDPQTRWRLKFEERFNYDKRTLAIVGSDQYRLRFDYRLSERWGLSYEQIQERRKSLLTRKGRQVERLTLTRSFGALDASFTYSTDRNIRDHSYYFTVRPALVYRNLVLPSQDLLVSSAEIGSEGETPEERNFDPFEMLKAKKKKKAAPGKAGGRDEIVPPPPLPSNQDERPATPPAPVPDKRSKRNGKSDALAGTPMFEDPDAPQARKRPKRIDDDDWTTPPPATPATSRKE